jgi:hypothetical protein
VEVGGAPKRRKSSKAHGCVVVCISSWGPLYIEGRGCPYPSTNAPGAMAKEEEKGGDGQGGASRPSTQTLTLAQSARV